MADIANWPVEGQTQQKAGIAISEAAIARTVFLASLLFASLFVFGVI